MRDGGRFLPHEDIEPDEDVARAVGRAHLLHRIAEALDLPVAAFSDEPVPSPSREGPTAVECAAVVAAFVRITDPTVRRNCLEMLERCGQA